MKSFFQYTKLQDFMGGVYNEITRASVHAKGLQTEYLVEMSKHHAPFPLLQLISRLEVDTFNIDFYFKEVVPTYSLWDRFLIWIKKREKLPENATYLRLSTKDAQSISFSVSVSPDKPGKMLVEPQLTTTIDYYVVTKVG